MQRPNETKRRKITDTAARLFATKPFHKVRLDDVAAAAQVGKGTLYIYFNSKEDLYASLIYDGFARLVDQLKQRVPERGSAAEALGEIVRELVRFAFDHPYIFEMMRAVEALKGHAGLARKRRQLIRVIEEVLCRGQREGVWADQRPELTAVFIPGLVRSAMLYGPRDVDEHALTDHILRLLMRGLEGGLP